MSVVQHIEDLAENDALGEADFTCAFCGIDILKLNDPRVAQCLHLYENKCLTKVRKGHGKGAKVACAYSGCGKDVSTISNKITTGDLQAIKEKYLVGLGEQNDEEDGESKDEHPDDETEAEIDYDE